MYRMGKAELQRLSRLIQSGKMYRYDGGECDLFEQRWAEHLGVKYARMTRSGTSAIYTALIGLGVGPGDQVIVPSYTYMATALGVLNAGAIPVVADVDESLTLCPVDLERRITKYTRAVIPVHMVGLPCNMREIMKIARRNNLLVLEDACQAVGGGYRGRKLGSIGHAGAFSFNFFKNISCGEGGAFAVKTKKVFDRASVAADCCAYYWNSDIHSDDVQFAGHNFRASEFEGAIMNVQLGRLDGILAKMRKQKGEIVAAGEGAGLQSIRYNSVEHECGTHVGFLFGNEKKARDFCDKLSLANVPSFLPMDTGRHVYTRWHPILREQGAHHPALDPFKIPANQKCRVKYSEDMCQDSIDILNRSVLIGMHPDNSRARIREISKAVISVT